MGVIHQSSINHSTKQSINQALNQPTIQPTNQPVIQWTKLVINSCKNSVQLPLNMYMTILCVPSKDALAGCTGKHHAMLLASVHCYTAYVVLNHAHWCICTFAKAAVQCSVHKTQRPQESSNSTQLFPRICGMYYGDAANSPGLPLPASHLMP